MQHRTLFSCFVVHRRTIPYFFFFFFNDTATTEIYTLSLHDALPIYCQGPCGPPRGRAGEVRRSVASHRAGTASASRGSGKRDRKSTRLNSSHSQISYAVFCLKKKKKTHPGTAGDQPTAPQLSVTSPS